MTITLYNNSSANNVVHKQMTALTTLSGTLKENVNMERVVVTIPYFANYSTCNYAYIPEFHRYYYVSVDVLNGQRLKLTMESDPLTSFYSQYAGSQVIAKRSSSNFNEQMVDNKIPFSPQPTYEFRQIGNAFTPTASGWHYILTLGGKG